MRARRLITAVFLLTCAKLAERQPAWPLAVQGSFEQWIEMAAVVGLDAFFLPK